MSPERIVARTKEFVITKGLAVLVTASMALGAAAYKLDDTQTQLATIGVNLKEMQGYMLTMQKDMYSMQQSLALTRQDVAYIKTDMTDVTAQVGEIITDIAKIRK